MLLLIMLLAVLLLLMDYCHDLYYRLIIAMYCFGRWFSVEKVYIVIAEYELLCRIIVLIYGKCSWYRCIIGLNNSIVDSGESIADFDYCEGVTRDFILSCDGLF